MRWRFTALYSSLFLLSGAGLLAITYALVNHAVSGSLAATGPHGANLVGSATLTGNTHVVSGPSGFTPRQLSDLAAQIRLYAEQQRATVLRELVINSGITLGVMAVISVVAGWLAAGRVLRPLRLITAAVRRISATDLGERLSLNGPDDELKELGDTFDGLLARLEASFRSQRQFVANASHELRTPLARQQTLVQVALGDPDATAASLRAAHERVLASGAQQARLIEALLTLTRGEAGLDRHEPFDLTEITRQVLSTRHSEVQHRSLRLHMALTPATAVGDSRLAEHLVANIVDNALRHNVAGGRVDVMTGTRDARAVLSVVNTGPAVPTAEVDRLVQPFQRLGTHRTSRGEGVGLGLSIVKAIADAHGAALTIQPQPSGGLKVRVSFPL